ncbi:winged helix-turn-helix domain-containing protein [Phreatobacter stygius]|uniref:Winged helix family transcriptional regulator n=1 Tax=Phreatobacter stygius TaxID=1940610 RepID=A0A4D7B2X6_9HYPH|nr:winged helix-turn-helix domain-containing protein [Phreatobacter stygius]QCI65655.1 winged helix family transcriptional regulator [Phreatobacter stygius]
MTSLAKRTIARLAADLAEAREHLERLERSLGQDLALPLEWRLTPLQGRVVSALLSRDVVPEQTLSELLYLSRGVVYRDPAAVKVHISNIRRRLRPFGIEIAHHRGRGYALAADVRARYGQRSAA